MRGNTSNMHLLFSWPCYTKVYIIARESELLPWEIGDLRNQDLRSILEQSSEAPVVPAN